MQWPKTYTIYLHYDKDSKWADSQDLGLSEVAASEFFPCYELEVEIEVHEDGSTFATHFNGVQIDQGRVKV